MEPGLFSVEKLLKCLKLARSQIKNGALNICMIFNIHILYRHIFKVWRKKRFELFLHHLTPSAADALLDVGGYPAFWVSRPRLVRRIDVVNIHEVSCDNSAPQYNLKMLLEDGCALPMPDQSYDIGFSNSVIEHVGSWERQQQFASEIRRVAKSLWVQTPAFACPLEPHYLAPLVHYLPRPWQKKILRWSTPWGWLERPTRATIDDMVENTRLLCKREMRQLFPDCEILTERYLWIIPKSYIAIRKFRVRGA